MKVLVVGGGGREHAIIRKLKENSTIKEIHALPGNGGMHKDAISVSIGAKLTVGANGQLSVGDGPFVAVDKQYVGTTLVLEVRYMG